MGNLFTIMVPAFMILIALLTIGMIFSRLYKRATKQISFVRTGLGGQKVIMNGGAMVFPVLHDMMIVNMNTLRLEVKRANDTALITRDRMRVDTTAEFYVRVQPDQESIANAAQTLGDKTLAPEELKKLVEGKFVDTLRAVAAEMDMTELHEKRIDFVQKVQSALKEPLFKNGLELESVSLTALNQTSKEYFNEDNVFDAEGLTQITREIQMRRKIRNDIEQETNVQIANKTLEAQKEQLKIAQDSEFSRLQQELEIANRTAQQEADIKRNKAEQDKQAEQATITAEREIELAKLERNRTLEQKRLENEQSVSQTAIKKNQTVETAEIERQKAIAISEQEKEIVVANKSRERSQAEADADVARQEAVRESEKVITAKATEVANRTKTIELIKAEQDAGVKATEITVAAKADMDAAESKKQATLTLAHADAENARIRAEGDAQATKIRAEADEKRYDVESEGKRKINEADNTLSAEQVAMQIQKALIEALPGIIRESTKSMENIDSIKIVKVDGLNGITGSANDGSTTIAPSRGNLAEDVVQSALKFRTMAPLLDSLTKDLGMNTGSLEGLTAPLKLLDGKKPETSANLGKE